MQDLRGGEEGGAEGKCTDTAMKEIKLPKYENWPGYEANLPYVLRRYCGIWTAAIEPLRGEAPHRHRRVGAGGPIAGIFFVVERASAV